MSVGMMMYAAFHTFRTRGRNLHSIITKFGLWRDVRMAIRKLQRGHARVIWGGVGGLDVNFSNKKFATFPIRDLV